MHRILLSAATVFVSIIGLAQSANERIATAMNTSDWLALDSIYNATPHDSIDSFLDVFSRALIGNRLNRPDVAIPAFEELLNDYSAGLDLSNLLNSSVLFAMDLSKVGNNAKAAAVVASVLEATKQHLDSAAIADGTVTIPNMVINTEDNALASDYECNLGLKSLMLFEKIRFNLVDFTITTYPTEISAFTSPIQKAPTFKLATKKKSAWQTAATVGLSVANGLLNTNAPTAPDL